MRTTRLTIFSVVILVVLGCESSVEPIANTGKEYSIYGSLDIDANSNYIRVYDTKKLLTPEDTKELNVNVIFTDLSNGDSYLLEDEVIKFENIYTHNYIIESPLDFDTRYKITVEDEDGFRDSLITRSPKKAEIVRVPGEPISVCSDRFRVEVRNIRLKYGEDLHYAIGFLYKNQWHWYGGLAPEMSLDENNDVVRLGWSPGGIMTAAFGLDAQHVVDWKCTDMQSGTMRFKYTHVGYMEDNPDAELQIDSTEVPVDRKVVLIKYEDEFQIDLESPLFRKATGASSSH